MALLTQHILEVGLGNQGCCKGNLLQQCTRQVTKNHSHGRQMSRIGQPKRNILVGLQIHKLLSWKANLVYLGGDSLYLWNGFDCQWYVVRSLHSYWLVCWMEVIYPWGFISCVPKCLAKSPSSWESRAIVDSSVPGMLNCDMQALCDRHCEESCAHATPGPSRSSAKGNHFPKNTTTRWLNAALNRSQE